MSFPTLIILILMIPSFILLSQQIYSCCQVPSRTAALQGSDPCVQQDLDQTWCHGSHERGSASAHCCGFFWFGLLCDFVHQMHVKKEGRGLSCTGVTWLDQLWLDSPYFEGVEEGFMDHSISFPTCLSHSSKPQNIMQPMCPGHISFRNSLLFSSVGCWQR